MKKTDEIRRKIESCKALQGKSILDVCNMPEFRANLEGYMKVQREDRAAIRASYEAMKKLGGAKGYKLPAHVIDDVINMSVDKFAAEFLAIINWTSHRPKAERDYIKQLGMQAYNLTIGQIVTKEFPELQTFFFGEEN